MIGSPTRCARRPSSVESQKFRLISRCSPDQPQVIETAPHIHRSRLRLSNSDLLCPSIVTQPLAVARLTSFCFATVSAADLHCNLRVSLRQGVEFAFLVHRRTERSALFSPCLQARQTALTSAHTSKGPRSYAFDTWCASPNFLSLTAPCRERRTPHDAPTGMRATSHMAPAAATPDGHRRPACTVNVPLSYHRRRDQLRLHPRAGRILRKCTL